jgi:hypothetical protein
MLVAVPPGAELEPGFMHWFIKLTTIAKEAGMPVFFYADQNTIPELERAGQKLINSAKIILMEFNNWDDFLIFNSELESDDLFIVITSRKDNVSYDEKLEKLPYYLGSYFKNNSFIIIYPRQLEQGINMENIQQSEHSLLEKISESGTIARVGSSLKKIFKGR